MKGIKKPLAKAGEKPKDNDKFIFEGKVKNLLFSGVLWYKLSNGLKWPDIGRLMEENGLNYKYKQFRKIESNWGAGSLIYFFHLYNVLKLPTPTPELLIFWDKEIERLRSERSEELRIKREKREARKRK